MKCCTKCGVTQPLDHFVLRKDRAPGSTTSRCKSCFSAYSRMRRAAKPEWCRDLANRRYAKNPGVYSARAREARKANPDATRAYVRKWRRKNPAVVNFHREKHRAAKLNACVGWADQQKMKQQYELARVFGYTVDHIVPLTSPLVCGLHVENNLRVIPAAENAAKGNRYWPDMPGT